MNDYKWYLLSMMTNTIGACQLQTEVTIVQQQAQQRREQLAGGINAITSVQNVSQTTNNYAAPFSFTGDESMGIRNYGAQPAR